MRGNRSTGSWVPRWPRAPADDVGENRARTAKEARHMLAEDDFNLDEVRPDVVRTRESISFFL